MKVFKYIASKLWFAIKWLYSQIAGRDARLYIKIAMIVAKMTPTKVDDKLLKSLLLILRFIDDSYKDLSITNDDIASSITENESIFRGFIAEYDGSDNVYNIGNDLFSVSYDPENGKITPSLKFKL